MPRSNSKRKNKSKPVLFIRYLMFSLQRLTAMYEKWLADDGKDLELTKKQIEELREKINSVQASQEVHEGVLSQKEAALADKEAVLTVSPLIYD